MLLSSNSARRTTSSRGDSLSARILAFTAATAGGVVAIRLDVGPALIREPEDVVVTVAGVAALVSGGWWIANVVAWASALRAGRTLRRFTLPGTRRLAQLLLAVSLSSSCVAEPSDGPAMVLVETVPTTEGGTRPLDGSTVEPAVFGTTETTVTTEATTPRPTTSAPITAPGNEASTSRLPEQIEPASEDTATASSPDPARSGGSGGSGTTGLSTVIPAHEIVVAPGDNLWTISRVALEQHGVDRPDCATVAAYWRLVVAGNHVRSGDPDLIVPGETISLPAYEASNDNGPVVEPSTAGPM